jgi:transcriptional regulator with XRE-family HTH domain
MNPTVGVRKRGVMRYRIIAYRKAVNVKGVTVMTLVESDVRVGARIRGRREQMGMSQRQLAGTAGISQPTLSRLESGENSGDNRFIIAAIARALRCPIEDLTGVYVPGAETTANTYDTVQALVAADLEFPSTLTEIAHIDQLRDRTAELVRLRKVCEFSALTRLAPALIRDLHAAVAGPDRDQVLRMMVRVAESASFAVRFTGQATAAYLAAGRAMQAARELGDPVYLALGEWTNAHGALGCGLHERAAQITQRAIRALEAAPDAEGRTEMLGMLYLTTAFAFVGAGRPADAVPLLAEANIMARHTGETDKFALMFGPTNCRLWELAIITDGGDPLDALPLIAETNIALIPSKMRQSVFHIDAARLLNKLGNVDQAVQHMETAEKIAPQRVHGDPIVVETVASMIDAVRRRAVSRRLAGLAQRVGAKAS